MRTILMLIAMMGLTNVAAEPQVLARRHELTAYLHACDNGIAAIEVVAPDGHMFSSPGGDFGTILRSLKIILPQACPNLKKVTVKGSAQGDVWFAGAAQAEGEWAFQSLYAPP